MMKKCWTEGPRFFQKQIDFHIVFDIKYNKRKFFILTKNFRLLYFLPEFIQKSIYF